MNNQPLLPEQSDVEQWESTVRDAARRFPYPPTPDIAGQVRRRLRAPLQRQMSPVWRLAGALLVALLVFTLAVPEVRAFVLDTLRIGVVRIFFVEPTAAPLPPTVIPTRVASVLELPGETTLDEARKAVRFPILLPAHPPDLGAPHRVFVQPFNAPVVTLVWLEADDPAAVRLALQILDNRTAASKYYPMEGNAREVTVNGRPALWLTDAHLVYLFGSRGEFSRVVDQNVLIWDEGTVTYRLETGLPLEEAVLIAESLE